MATHVARMDYALRKLGHRGLSVKIYDYDKVSESNVSRQMFAESEVGLYKSQAICNRINMFFGFNYRPLIEASVRPQSNLCISCVDNSHKTPDNQYFRQTYNNEFLYKGERYDHRIKPYYWMDLGNDADYGQVIMGSKSNEVKAKDNVQKLPTIIDVMGEDLGEGKTDTPSCSLAEALGRQDLSINTAVAAHGFAILWQPLRHKFIEYHGMFINLARGETQKLTV